MKASSKQSETAAPGWLTLVFQLSAKPAYLRVKVWRRLQAIGAVSLKNAVYVLPASDDALEDFQWLLGEIEKSGGEGAICEMRLLQGMRDDEVRALFGAARDADYDELAKELQAARKPKGRDVEGETKALLLRARKRFAEIAEIDFFGATGRLRVEGLLAEMEARMAKPAAKAPAEAPRAEKLKGKIWVTRRDIHVDRIACAWLVRRFVDPSAKFKFVAEKDYRPKPSEVRFDMFKGEITHEGDKCSFEVLLERAGLDDPALAAIAEIVHDIDLKDRKFVREETVGISHVIAGICAGQSNDHARIEQASPMFDGLYERFRKTRRR